jgi:hypothetical protein
MIDMAFLRGPVSKKAVEAAVSEALCEAVSLAEV